MTVMYITIDPQRSRRETNPVAFHLRLQDRAHHLGHAGQGRSLPRLRPRVGCCLIEGDSRRARASAYRKGNFGVMANGQETGIETLRTVIARRSAPQ
jgi:hypothetical protein